MQPDGEQHSSSFTSSNPTTPSSQSDRKPKGADSQSNWQAPEGDVSVDGQREQPEVVDRNISVNLCCWHSKQLNLKL